MSSDADTPTQHPLARFVRRLQSHCALSAEDIRAILSLPIKRMARDRYSHLVREGDFTRQCAILISGMVERHRLASNGDRQILAIYIGGDPLDLDHFFLPHADDALQTLKRSELALVSHADLRKLIETRPTVANAIVVSLLVDSSVFREWTINVGRRDARARLAHLLCELAFRMEAQGLDSDELALPLTQYHLADATGLTPVHVNRTLKAMQAEGLLSTTAGMIRSEDWKRLREVAGFSARYLHSSHEAETL